MNNVTLLSPRRENSLISARKRTNGASTLRNNTRPEGKMSSYNPPSFPRRLKTFSLFSELRYQAHLIYYRYEINTALYGMSPDEKLAYNIILASFLLLLLSAVYYYLPSAIYVSIYQLSYYFTGQYSVQVPGIAGLGVLESSTDVMTS